MLKNPGALTPVLPEKVSKKENSRLLLPGAPAGEARTLKNPGALTPVLPEKVSKKEKSRLLLPGAGGPRLALERGQDLNAS